MNKAAEVILGCLAEQGMTQSKLAEGMGEDIRHLNQQLNRQKDLKVERFIDVLDHIGYRVEIVENDGIRKVCQEFAWNVVEEKAPAGKFWHKDGDWFIGIDNSNGQAWVEKFASKEECFAWLRGSEK